MGQKVGKARFVEGTEPFINLPTEAIRALWKEFNLSAEGWGLNPPMFAHICSVLTEFLNCDRTKMDELANKLFLIYDTDKNDLVDGMEFISSLGMVCGMDASETVEFVFACYDFGETRSLTLDELTLLCRSTAAGLCKLTGHAEPHLDQLAQVAERVFRAANKDGNGQVSLEEFTGYAEKNPVVGSWLRHFDDVDVPAWRGDAAAEPDEGGAQNDAGDSDLERDYPERTPQEEALFRNAGFELGVEEAAEGDEFMAARPYLGALVPPEEPPREVLTAPDSTATLGWVHGYRSQDMRGNLRYTAKGAVVYPAAAVGVVLSTSGEEAERPWDAQKFNFDHTDDITALAVTPDGAHCATGELGKRPKIVVWDADTAQTVTALAGFHERAVQYLDFSSDGQLLASIGRDNNNSLAIYDWRKRQLVFSAKCGPQKVLDCRWAFGGNNSVLASCGDKHMFFWTRGDGRAAAWAKKKGIRGGKYPVEETMVCLAHGGREGALYSGSVKGRLMVWQGRNCKRAVKAHVRSVSTLYFAVAQRQLLSGGRDGKVKIWDPALTALAVLDVLKTSSLAQGVRSVCLSADGQRALVGTAGSEVFELRATGAPMPPEVEALGEGAEEGGEEGEEGGGGGPYLGTVLHGGPLAQGHFRGEVWGLAVSPKGGEYATAGDDWTVRTWSVTEKRQLKALVLDCMARAAAYNPEGTLIAVGLGGDLGTGGPRAPKEGGVVVLNAPDLTVVWEGKDAKEWISDLKFSPDGNALAVGSHDNNIYLYNTSPEWGLRATLEGHNSYITHLDFTADGAALRSTCGAYELLFWDAAEGEQKPSGASELRDAEWDTTTCPLTWDTQGVFPAFADGTDVNAVDRAKEGKLLATSDDFGRLKLFNWPCATKGAGFDDCRGHSSHVTNVKFTLDERNIVTAGGNDRCVFQWDLVLDEAEDSGEEAEEGGEEEAAAAEEEEEEDEEGEGAEPPESGEDEDLLGGAEKLERAARYDAHMGFDQGALFEMEAAATGDEFAAVKPWLCSVVAPQDAEAQVAAAESLPEDDLELEWVHGYNARMVRGGVRYNKDGHVVYHGGAVGVVLDKAAWAQKFCVAHTDDITSLALHPDGYTVATGQRGREPRVVVWDSRTGRALATLAPGRVRAVWELAFSPCGRLLACAGEDDDHTVCVFDWREGRLRSQARGGRQKVLALAFSPDSGTLLQAGVKHFKFWKLTGRNMQVRKGLFGKGGKIQPLTAAAYVNGVPVLGGQDGAIYRVDDRKIDSEIARHGKAVNAFCVYRGGEEGEDGQKQEVLVSAGKDGKVFKFDAELNQDGEEFDLGGRGLYSKELRSVHVNPDFRKFLLATNGSEIIEISTEDGAMVNEKPLVTGHSKDELWGLGVHPVKAEYATVGDDKTLRVWDAETKRQTRWLRLDDFARAVAYSPNGHLLGVGMGGDVGRGKRRKDGAVCVVSLLEEELRVVNEMHDAKEWVSDVKFSPDGNTLAAGSHDNNIYLYDVLKGFELRAVCQAHQSYITHFDFSADSAWIQSTCGAYELLYFETATGQQNPGGASELKDVAWATWTVPLGWPVQGIWPPLADGTDVNAVCRMADGKYLVTADDFGKVKLMAYPAADPERPAPFKDYVGHSSHVTNVRVLTGDRHVVSVGGHDKCVFQWRRDFDDQEEEAPETFEPEEDDDEALGGFDLGQLGVEAAAEGDEFQAVKPWLGALEPPSKPPAQDPSAPRVRLELEAAHGARGALGRIALALNAANDPVWAAAGLGVILDRRGDRQAFFAGHDDEVTALAVSRDGRYVVSGQQGKRPKVFVWSSETGKLISELPPYHRRGVQAVAFSPCGTMAASIGLDNDHSLCVYNTCLGDWSDGAIQAWSAVDKSKVLFVTFTGNDDFQIITGGVKTVKFWRLQSRNISCRKGIFGKIGKIQPITGCVMVGGKAVTGTASGALYVWEGNRVARAVEGAHARAVTCLNFADGGGFVSGGRDGRVVWWSPEVEQLAAFDLARLEDAPSDPVPVAVDIDAEQAKVAVGTAGAELYELSVDSGAGCRLGEGHGGRGELWGLAAHPSDPDQYATAGDDGSVRVWSVAGRGCLRRGRVSGEARALAYSPDGALLAVGLNTGGLEVLGAEDLEVRFRTKEAREWVQDVKFSPDGQTLAVGSHDNNIYLYSVKAGDQFDFYGRCSQHNSYITHFDFDKTSQYLRSNCGGYELLFFKVSSAEHLPGGASELRDAQWATETCVLGWAVQGIWPEEADGTDINSVDRSKNGKLLATADDFGNVRIFNYPVVEKEAQFIVGKGHSSHVTNVRFNADDTYLLTTGGNDRTVLQWKLT